MTTNNKCFSDTLRARLVRYSMQYVLQTTYFEKALVEIPYESPRRDTLGTVQNSFIFRFSPVPFLEDRSQAE